MTLNEQQSSLSPLELLRRDCSLKSENVNTYTTQITYSILLQHQTFLMTIESEITAAMQQHRTWRPSVIGDMFAVYILISNNKPNCLKTARTSVWRSGKSIGLELTGDTQAFQPR